MTDYFLDSSAIIEHINGNERFKAFVNEASVTTLYNAMEVYYILLREAGESVAQVALEMLSGSIVQPDVTHVASAMKLRLQKRTLGIKLSYADCLGYTMARELHRAFVTTDRAFKGMAGVRLVALARQK